MPEPDGDGHVSDSNIVCPKCGLPDLDEDTVMCPACGFSLAEETADQDGIPPLMEANVRRELEREFRIEGVLGRGGMSIVYLARERDLNRLVAIKVLPLQLTMGPDAVDRFKREAKIAASLDHPHIVPIYRIGATPTFMWYSMKWVKGRSLRDILAETGPMSLDDVVKTIEPVAAALDHAHRRGIVHRDVKPENVLIDESGWVTVCDFGIAKAFGTVPLTQTGGTLGTPAYMSTEQCYGQALDGRSDQYSLATLTYECLAGTPPFSGESLGEIVRKHCLELPPPLAEKRPELPGQVAEALQRALSKNPGDRFDDVLQFAQALGGAPIRPTPTFVTTTGLQDTVATAPTEPVDGVRPKRRWRFWVAAAATTVVLGGVGAITWITRPDASTPDPTPTEAVVDSVTEPGLLFVSSTPWGYVYVDDSLVGESPQAAVALTPGQHVIRIVQEGFQPYEEAVEVVAGEEMRLTNILLEAQNSQ
jgi:serine/threonine-protein kinase